MVDLVDTINYVNTMRQTEVVMVDVETIDLGKAVPPGVKPVSLWIQHDGHLERVIEDVDRFVLHFHKVGDAPEHWSVVIPQNTDPSVLMAILNALRDYCVKLGLTKTASAIPEQAPKEHVRRISIPLGKDVSLESVKAAVAKIQPMLGSFPKVPE